MDVRDPRARLIVPALPEAGGTVRVTGEEAAHARARRLVSGDIVVLLDGTGRHAEGDVLEVSRAEVLVRISRVFEAGGRGPSIALFVAGIRPERLSWLVEKATELGAGRVVIVASERTQSFRASVRLLPRLDRVAREAAKQCGRSDWPRTTGPIELSHALEEESAPHRFFLEFQGEPFPRRLEPSAAALLVGPEGGWTDAEKREASKRGWKIVALPAGRLRAETAAIVGLALLNAAMER